VSFVSAHPFGSAVVTYNCHTVSESNARGHWAPRAKRAAAQRMIAKAQATRYVLRALPAIVTLVRIAPRALDDDNLRGALKATRDGVADAFGVNDRDPRIEWRYGQRRGPPRAFQVEIGTCPAREPETRPELTSADYGPKGKPL